jgi:uncharacterized protein
MSIANSTNIQATTTNNNNAAITTDNVSHNNDATNIARYINLTAALEKKSIFLFGPRQTGKSWLIKNTLQNHTVYNLLHHDTFLKLNQSPQLLREEFLATRYARQQLPATNFTTHAPPLLPRTPSQPPLSFIIIDEIQRIPELLNEVHAMIEDLGVHFLLTGSSARKLRRGGVNLLGGRAHIKQLHPFSYCELKNQFSLERAINYGLLPSIYLSTTASEDLRTYIGTYLKEEIAAEGLTRNIPAFSRFLTVAAHCNGKMINYTKIANDAQVARSTVQEYFAILKDTLLAYELPAWTHSQKRKPISTAKLYLFDLGVARILQDRNTINPNTPEFGEAFESYIFHELKTFADYHDIDKLNYWRSISDLEVDFILGDEIAIEVKGSKNIAPQDLKNLKALREEQKLKKYILVCCEQVPRVVDGITILPWQLFLDELWGNGKNLA